MEVSDSKMQELADEFTGKVLTAMYGDRFTNIDNIEDDPEMDAHWEHLNEKFYALIEREVEIAGL